MIQSILPLLVVLLAATETLAAQPWVTYDGKAGPGKGKHIVLISGDEEYRSEEALPQLGKILAVHHGFKCTVLFAVNPDTGTIDPNRSDHIPGLETLGSADLMILFTRFRNLPDQQMQHIIDYVAAGKPLIGIRTATHAFNIPADRKHHRWSWDYQGGDFAQGFGRQILGETWVSHHGHHGKESGLGLIAPDAQGHPILRGIKDGDIWGDTDVYTVRLPMLPGIKPLVLGQVLTGMEPDDPPVEGKKNDPMMPIAWLKQYTYDGNEGAAFCSTLGAASDLVADGSRRLFVNATYHLLGMGDKIPAEGAKADLVGRLHAIPFGNNRFRKGIKPADHALASSPSARLELNKGDRIAIIGNGQADRMQHHGWMETILQLRFPQHGLSFRNLGYTADSLTIRQRVDGFGSPDDWLKRTAADVIFAFFGLNESFAGRDGLAKFRHELESFIRHTVSQKYNGKSKPRLVLFSPIAFENHATPNLPDGTIENIRIGEYVQTMAEVTRAERVHFVDLFKTTLWLYANGGPKLTLNGVHLTNGGNRHVAEMIDAALFGQSGQSVDLATLIRIRAAVLDKNTHWFNRYRTPDGYNVYGGRSALKFVDDLSNYTVTQHELKILDVMTANRDRRIWAIARGSDLTVSDDNVPANISVKTNKPGDGPDGKHLFLGGEEVISTMQIANGFKVNLFASEQQFPDLVNPVQMAFDTKGRLWVSTWPTYPHWTPRVNQRNDKLLILVDGDGDGKAETRKVFADGLHNPTGFEFWGGGVIVANCPDLLFLKDTDGDDVADQRIRILGGISSGDTHHSANSFVLDPAGWIYFQEGVFHRTQVETPYGPVRNRDGAVWRFNPRTYQVERYAAYGFANPHGHVVDRWGQHFVHDGTGAVPFHGTVISGHLDSGHHGRAPQLYQQRTRPCPGTEILSSRHFPDASNGNLLVGNVIGFQGILQYRIEPDGSSFHGVEVEPILHSTDANFRPLDMEIGPDGAIYFTEWQNPIIGHMQHHVRDPSRDQEHGRVYRVTFEGRPLLEPKKVAGEPIDKLLELLEEPEDRLRYRTRIELSGRDSQKVIAAATKWMAGLPQNDPDYEHHLLEGLWLHASHNVVEKQLLKRILGSTDHRARAAAVKVLCDWRHRAGDSLSLLKERAGDEHPLVRLEAIRAASFFTDPKAALVALECLRFERDRFTQYVLSETIRALEPYWKPPLIEGRMMVGQQGGPAIAYLLDRIGNDQLLKIHGSPEVYTAILARPDIPSEKRLEAVKGLARLQNTDRMSVLLEAISKAEESDHGPHLVEELGGMLLQRPLEQLRKARDRFKKMALEGKTTHLRRVGFAAWITADGSQADAYASAHLAIPTLRDFLYAIGLISDPNVRAASYPTVRSLLFEQSEHQSSADSKANADGSVQVAAIAALVHIPGPEKEIFNGLADLLIAGRHRTAVTAALLKIDRSHWQADQARKLINAVLGYASKLPPKQRTAVEVLSMLEFGRELASLLPEAQATQATAMLENLDVNIIVIRPVPHEMRYDRTEISVAAGKPIEIIFQNTDIMPHNLVITVPGAMARVGKAAEAMGTAGESKGFIPDGDDILWHTKLLLPGESEKLQFTAPARPGRYPFVCTFPGHWLVMNGIMQVLEQGTSPSLAEATPQFPTRPFVKMWAMKDFVDNQTVLGKDIDLDRGRRMYAQAGCITCHSVQDDGVRLAPDLGKIREKYKGLKLLEQVIDPSTEINEQFLSYIVETIEGDLLTGVILKQDADEIHLVGNLQSPEQVTVLKRSEIASLQASKLSPMPTGLLTTLQKQEILDLLGFIESGQLNESK